VVIQHPGVVVHGIGAWVAEPAVSALQLISLDPGGPGAAPLVGLVAGTAMLAALVFRPHRSMLPGLALTLLGVLAVVALRAYPAVPLTGGPAQHGWAGAGLLVVGWGMLWSFLASCRHAAHRPVVLVRIACVLGALSVAALGAGVLMAGRDGPLRADGGPKLAPTLVNELRMTGRSVLLVPGEGEPVRQVAGRPPRFADDDLAPVPSAVARLTGQDAGLRSAEPDRAREAVASAAVAGVAFVVLPDAATAARLRAEVGDLVSDAPPVSDGRPVLRVQLAAGQVTLLSPELARQALTGGPPPGRLGTAGIVAVEASPPNVAVRVSDGPDGRLLVIAAEEEPGWRAMMNGRPVPVARAWSHLVSVQVPTRAAEIRVEQPTGLRGALLLIQAAAVLFTLLTAVPAAQRSP
jgi:hypothetical protein